MSEKEQAPSIDDPEIAVMQRVFALLEMVDGPAVQRILEYCGDRLESVSRIAVWQPKKDDDE